MRLIFIRHGDRLGDNDILTEKGKREAQLLSERVAGWKDIRKIYMSPFQRVKDTAAPSLEKLGMDAEIKDWLAEFEYMTTNPTTGIYDVPWDLCPEYYNDIPELFEKDKWLDTGFYRSNPEIRPAYENVCRGIDSLLAEYGVIRDNIIYRYDVSMPRFPDEDTILFFSHFGISTIIISHLINIPAPSMLMHFVCPPTGITVLNTEERPKGGALHFRVQCFGDTTHLKNAGEPLSTHAAFSPLFNL